MIFNKIALQKPRKDPMLTSIRVDQRPSVVHFPTAIDFLQESLQKRKEGLMLPTLIRV